MTVNTYQHYRALIVPYLRYMALLSYLFRTCGIEISSQGAVLITEPRWMSVEAAACHKKAARAIAHLRHALTLTDKESVHAR